MSLLKVNEIQVFNGTTVTITATTTIASADLTVTDDLDVGGALTLGTALAIAEGGTGATTASAARTALGLEIGADVQAYDADTAKYDDTTANFTGTLQNGGSNVVVDSDIGSTVQAYDAGLTSIAGLTTAANKIIYTTASDTYAVTDLTAAGRAILDDADAAAQRTTLGLGTAATTASTDYATAAQGSLADSAVQPGDDAANLGSGSATDGYVLTADGSGGSAWEAKAPIDLLSSGASIRKSDGSTAVLSESGGAVTLENVTNAYLSGGVYLGGTGAANYLDDYETGTFTPTATPSSGSFGSTSVAGNYRKIGSLVYVHISITITNLGTASGYMNIGGLPFSVQNAGRYGQIPILVRETYNVGDIYGGFLGNSGTDGRIHGFSNSAATINMALNDTFNVAACYAVS